ncbi:MAG: hypothetical protein WAU36_18680 [Cyclobacteriaceae bacterium]
MSTFIDFQIKQGNSRNGPVRVMNGPWREEQISETISKAESWPLNPGPKIRDLYTEVTRPSFKLWILGEVYSYKSARLKDGKASIINAITQDVASDQLDAAQLNGHFVMLVYYTKSSLWKLYTDRLGTYHIYYGTVANTNVLGTYYRAVSDAMQTKTLNEEALQGYLSCGFFLQNTTFFKEIDIMKGSTEYTFDKNLNLISRSVYWKPTHNPRTRSYSDTIDLLSEVINNVTEDLTSNGRIAIPISGGLDSRMMAGVCTLPDIGTNKKFWSYSYGYAEDSVEIKIASKVAMARNLPFKQKVISNYLFDRQGEVSDCIELFQYIDGTRQADIVEDMSIESDYVMAAHWGDVWFDAMAQEGSLKGKDLSGYAFNKFKKNGSDWLVNNVLHTSLDSTNDWVKEALRQELNTFDSIADPDFKIKMLKTTQWSFRWTLASIRMFQSGAFPRLPFYDNRIVDLFATIPTSFLVNRKLQIDYLKRYHPDLAAITWQEYGSNLYRYKYWNNRMLPYRILSKIARTVKGTSSIARNWEIFYLNKEGRQNLTNNLLNSPLTSIVSKDEIHKLLNEFYRKPDGGNGYTISMLHTYAIFLKMHLG